MLWNKSLETGVALMDSQHQELFRQMDVLSDKSKADRVPQTLDFLGKYVDKHFRDEERLQTTSAYPQREEHAGLHRAFVEQYKELQDEFLRSPERQGLMVLRINRIALDWLRKHIAGPDRMFARYYLEKHGKATTAPVDGIAAPSPPVQRQPPPKPPSRQPLAHKTPLLSRPPEGGNFPRDEDVLRRLPTRALADELVRRSRM